MVSFVIVDTISLVVSSVREMFDLGSLNLNCNSLVNNEIPNNNDNNTEMHLNGNAERKYKPTKEF